MIIGSDTRMTIGEHGKGLTDNDCVVHPEQPFIVLREATVVEWLAEYAADIAPDTVPTTIAAEAKARNARNAWFYEVSMD